MTGKGEYVSCGIRHLGMSQHLDVLRRPMEIKTVAPTFLVRCHDMDIVMEKEKLPVAVVPALFRRKHVVFLPCVRSGTEGRKVLFRLIQELCGLNEYRISEHIHIVLECEHLYL